MPLYLICWSTKSLSFRMTTLRSSRRSVWSRRARSRISRCNGRRCWAMWSRRTSGLLSNRCRRSQMIHWARTSRRTISWSYSLPISLSSSMESASTSRRLRRPMRASCSRRGNPTPQLGKKVRQVGAIQTSQSEFTLRARLTSWIFSTQQFLNKPRNFSIILNWSWASSMTIGETIRSLI